MPEALSDSLKLFVSYSRANLATADQMVEQLEQAGFEVTIDRRDLPYGEKWQAELTHFIREADTVLWLVSPDSIGSKWCNWELGEVQRLNKRLVTVRVANFDLDTMPEAIGAIEILPKNGVFDFNVHLGDLVATLETDRAWLKEHTRLGDRARQWDLKERRGDLLLRGSALNDAEAWRDKQPKAAPQPSEDILDLILASRRAHGQRQRMTVAGSLAVAMVAIALSGVALWQRNEAQEQTRIAEAQREIAEANEARAIEQEQIAEQRATEAEEARQQAQDALDQATETANGVVFDLAQKFRDLGLPTSVFTEILGEARALQDALAEHAADNPDLLGSRAAALGMIGDAYIAQGRTEEALAVYEEALALRRSIADQIPDDMLAQYNLTVAIELIGSYRRRTGDDQNALAAYLESLELRRQLAKDNPDQPVLRSAVTSSLVVVGDIRLAAGDSSGAMEAYLEADALRADLVREYPENGDFKYRLSLSKLRVGAVHMASGDFSQARDAFRDAVGLLETIVAQNPENTAWKFEIAGALASSVAASYALGETEDIIPNLEAALAVMDELVGQDPQNTTWAMRRRDMLLRLGQIHAIGGNKAEAQEYLEQALELAESLLAADPSNATLIRDTADNLANLGDLLLEQGETDRAVAELHRSVGMIRGLVETDPGNSVWITELSEQLTQLGGAYLANARVDDAVAAFEEALLHARRLVEQDRDVVEPQIRIIVALVRLAAQTSGPTQQAYYQEGLEIAERLASEGKLSASRASWPDMLRLDLARSYGNSAWEEIVRGQFERAEQAARRGLEIGPGETWISANLAHALMLQGDETAAGRIYLELAGRDLGGQSWEDLILADFAALRDAGLDHPHMAVIEAAFADAATAGSEAAE